MIKDQSSVRNFILGDEWVYLKVYSGPKILEKILINEIYDLVLQQYEEKSIDKFFFIRYYDEDYHLRLRFHVIKQEAVEKIIMKINSILTPYLHSGVVWKVVYDTYMRELERYGSSTIEETETIFFFNSMIVIESFKNIINIGSEFGEDTIWLYAIKLVNDFLNDFDINNEHKIKILGDYSETMNKEFNVNKNDRTVLNDIYRSKRFEIESMLNTKLLLVLDKRLNLYRNNEVYKHAINTILEKKQSENLEIHFDSLLQSFIHMINNRVFRTNQRQNEMFIYYLITKCLISIEAKKRIECLEKV